MRLSAAGASIGMSAVRLSTGRPLARSGDEPGARGKGLGRHGTPPFYLPRLLPVVHRGCRPLYWPRVFLPLSDAPNPQRVPWIFGVTERLREMTGAGRPPYLHGACHQAVAAARVRFGAAGFDARFSAGRSFPLPREIGDLVGALAAVLLLVGVYVFHRARAFKQFVECRE